MARRHRPTAHHPCGSTGNPADPRWPQAQRHPDRHSHRPAFDAVRVRRRSRLTVDCTARRADGAGGRARRHRDRRRVARRDPRCGVALRHDHRHGSRRCDHAGDHAAGGARLVSGAHRLCHSGLHQRPADRRNPAGGVDASAGAATGRRKLAMGLRGLERASRRYRRPGAGTGAGIGQWTGIRCAPPLVAGLEQSADLAARHHARHHQRHLFRDQRLPAGLPQKQRTERMDQRGAIRTKCRPGAGVVPVARGRRPPGAQGVALRRLRAALRDRDRRDRVRFRRLDRGGGHGAGLCRLSDPHSDPGAAALAERAG